MDRDQQSRRQKSGAASRSASRPKNRAPQRPRQAVPPKRGLGSRVGLEKRADRSPSRPARQAPPQKPAAPAQQPRAASARGASRPQAQGAGPARNQPPARSAPPPARPAPQSRPRPNPAPPASGQNPQSAAYRPGAPRHRRRVTQVEKMRIRRRRKLVGIACVAGVLLLGVVLSINLLFKVTDFRIENTDRTTPANTGIYTEEQILDLLGVQVGDNLFGFSTSQKSRELQAQLPYLDVVQVDIQMPGTVVVKVQPATERFAIQTAAGWLVLSDGLKVLRSDSAQPEGLIQLQVNLDPRLSQTPGSYLSLLDSADAVIAATAETATAETATDEDAAASRADTALDQLVQQLEDTGLLDGVTLISLQDMEEINFLYQGRVSVVLGTANNLPYKLQIASRIVLDTDGTGLASTDRGTLDVSYQRSDGSIVGYFTPAQTAASDTTAGDDSGDASGQDGGDTGTDSAGAGQTDGETG